MNDFSYSRVQSRRVAASSSSSSSSSCSVSWAPVFCRRFSSSLSQRARTFEMQAFFTCCSTRSKEQMARTFCVFVAFFRSLHCDSSKIRERASEVSCRIPPEIISPASKGRESGLLRRRNPSCPRCTEYSKVCTCRAKLVRNKSKHGGLKLCVYLVGLPELHQQHLHRLPGESFVPIRQGSIA